MCYFCTFTFSCFVFGVRVHQIDLYVCVGVWLAGGRAREFDSSAFFYNKKSGIFHQKKCDFLGSSQQQVQYSNFQIVQLIH